MEGLRAKADAGIGDTAVEPPECLHCLGGGLHNSLLIGHIDLPGFRFALADPGELFRGRLVVGLLAPPDRDMRAGSGQALCHAKPDTLVAARDERHFSREIERCVSHLKILHAVWIA